MIVVIPVADEPVNPTLPLAIETIRRHTDYDIVTIGRNHRVARHLHLAQSPRGHDRFINTDNAMRLACHHFDTFIWSADDTYWTRPAEPTRWALGQLPGTHDTGTNTRKANTRKWLLEHGHPTWDYEVHVPMLIDAAPMREVMTIIKESGPLDKRSLYGNLTGQPDLIAPDVKIRNNEDPIPDAPWISSNGTHQWETITHLVGATP